MPEEDISKSRLVYHLDRITEFAEERGKHIQTYQPAAGEIFVSLEEVTRSAEHIKWDTNEILKLELEKEFIAVRLNKALEKLIRQLVKLLGEV